MGIIAQNGIIYGVNDAGHISYDNTTVENALVGLESGQAVLTSVVNSNVTRIQGLESGQAVLTSVVNSNVARIEAVESGQAVLTSVTNTHTQNITALQSDKVDKVDGKGLSANDYTNADKTIVDGVAITLNSIQASLTALQTSLNTLVSDLKWIDVSSQIDFNGAWSAKFPLSPTAPPYTVSGGEGYYNKATKTLRVSYTAGSKEFFRTGKHTPAIQDVDLSGVICFIPYSIFDVDNPNSSNLTATLVNAAFNDGDYTQIFGIKDNADATGFECGLNAPMLRAQGSSSIQVQLDFGDYFKKKNSIYYFNITFDIIYIPST